MRYRTLGKTGLKVSELGLGASQLGRREVEEKDVERLLRGALDLGVNFIDTAAMYKLSEERIGRYLGDAGDKVIIATKAGDYSVPDGNGFRTVVDFSPEAIFRTIEESRVKLRREVLDIVQFHGLPRDPDQHGPAIDALRTARERGWVRFIGISLDQPLPADGSWPDDTQEFTYNVLEQESAATLIPAAVHRGAGVIIKRPIANAVFLMDEDPKGTYYRGSWLRAQQMDVRELAGGQSPVDFALRFALSHPEVHTAIVGTTRLENLARNVAVCEQGPLTEAQVQAACDLFTRCFASPDAVNAT